MASGAPSGGVELGEMKVGAEELVVAGNVNSQQSYWAKLPRQVYILLKKNCLQLLRNPYSSFMRLSASMFFMILMYVIVASLNAAEQGKKHVIDLPHPEAESIGGIPPCDRSGCTTLTYVPAPKKEFEPPDGDLPDSDFDPDLSDAQKEEQKRVHKVIRSVMDNNKGSQLKNKVLGFRTEREMDDFLLANLGLVTAGLVFTSPTAETTGFAIQANSTSGAVMNVEVPRTLIPIQVAVSQAISKEMLGQDVELDLSLQGYAHPKVEDAAQPVDSSAWAPLFILCSLIFPFVVQAAEVLAEKEKKLRTQMNTMGLLDSAHWISWHIFHAMTTFLSSLILTIWGYIFGYEMFVNNDFGVLLFTFWFFSLAMNGVGFMLTGILRTSSQALIAGVAVFFLGFILAIMTAFGIPYGTWPVKDSNIYMNCTALSIVEVGTKLRLPVDIEPKPSSFRYLYESCSEPEIRGNPNVTRQIMHNGEAWVPVLMTFIPMVPLSKNLNDLGAMAKNTSDWLAYGMNMNNVTSYCQTNTTTGEICDKDYALGNTWGILFGLYLFYSVIAIYLDNVLPDVMGARKPPNYFLLKSYWGLEEASISQKAVEQIEPSDDDDVLQEEQILSQRVGQAMAPENAIEVRGLRKTFRRNGKPFHAVKCPQFAIQKNKLFALLGHNGAGKTTLFNMLTGVLPPTDGEGLVENNTITHASGVAYLRSMIGVCPQFDVLWENLTAMEHLEIYATLKGLPATSIKHEGQTRLEEVRLTDVADKNAGKFSGGMKRRLSVAVSLIGNPSVLFLDEPTTGMDPVSRRHVWDVIEAAKQTRAVILTTHSMEEADILADRLAIIAKGRLRCLGTSVHLKQKFGAGYLVIVACESESKRTEIKKLFMDHVSAEPEKESKSHINFNVETSKEDRIPSLFEALESRKAELEITDIQLAMSTLEDVFLKISRDAEQAEQAAAGTNVTVPVTLPSGEVVSVRAGSEETFTSPSGKQYRVKWGLDDYGNMIAVDTIEADTVVSLSVSVPEGVSAGGSCMVQHDGQNYTVTVPEGLSTGDTFTTQVTVAARKDAVSVSVDGGEYKHNLTDEELEQRVQSLRPSFPIQAKAVSTKIFNVQKRKKFTNCCMCFCPGFTITLIMMMQWLIEFFFVKDGMAGSRCTYCGPADDDFGKAYCGGKDCWDYFWNEGVMQDQYDYVDLTRVQNAKDHCRSISETCGGNGNISCFWIDAGEWDVEKTNYSIGRACANFKFNPDTFEYSVYSSLKPLSFLYAPKKDFLSDTPVAFTASDTTKAKAVLDQTFKDPFPPEVTSNALDKTLNGLYSLFMLPHLGCGMSINTTQMPMMPPVAVNLTSPAHESLCKLLQHNQGTNDPCCFDTSSDGVSPPTTEVAGLNTWTRDDGVKFYASGRGKDTIQEFLGRMFDEEFGALYASALQPQFTCVKPAYSTEMASRLPADDFISLQAGLAVHQQVFNLEPKEFHPEAEPNREIPKCTADGNCEAVQGRWSQSCYWDNWQVWEWADRKCGPRLGTPCTISYIEVVFKALFPNWMELLQGDPYQVTNNIVGGLLSVLDVTLYPQTLQYVTVLVATGQSDEFLSRTHNSLWGSSEMACMCRYHEAVKRFAIAEVDIWRQTLFTDRELDGLPQLPRTAPAAAYPNLKPFGFDDLSYGSLLATPRSYFEFPWYDPDGDFINYDTSLRWRRNYWTNAMEPQREELWFSSGTVQRVMQTIQKDPADQGGYVDEMEVVQGGDPCPEVEMEKPFVERRGQCDCFYRQFRYVHPLTEGSDPVTNYDVPAKWTGFNTSEECEEPDIFDFDKPPYDFSGYTVLAKDCDGFVKPAMGMMRMLGNVSDMAVECVSMKTKEAADHDALDNLIYEGHYTEEKGANISGYVTGVDFVEISDSRLQAVIMQNISQEVLADWGFISVALKERQDRMMAQINGLLKGFLATITDKHAELLVGWKSYPAAPSWGTAIEIGSSQGPLFITLTFLMVFPDMVTGLVAEKESRVRIMMKMMGLAEVAYITMTYAFWAIFLWLYSMLFLLLANLVKLHTSGYQIGMFKNVDGGVQVLFFTLVPLNQVSLAFVFANLIKTEKASNVITKVWYYTNLLIIVALGNTANFFDSEGIPSGMKSLITMFPPLGVWRTMSLWAKYANVIGNPGLAPTLTWNECGVNDDMGSILLIFGLEIPIFLIVALYVEQITDIGYGVAKHPLFCFGFGPKDDTATYEGVVDDGDIPDDVQQEKQRVTALAGVPRSQQDTVVVNGLRKVFPGNPEKVAVRNLYLGIKRGECFGMLGPNGAGKTTTINMLVGFSQPTQGDARVEGYSIKSRMDLIYSLMGVCPQHDIIWGTLTAQEHLLFYGTLKKLKGQALQNAITEALKEVNLLDVRHSPVQTFSGGMKRRLSVAISLIGSPMVTYLDEPSTGLDPASRRLLWNCITKAKRNRSILLTTHSMEEAEGLCDRLGIFVDGALACIGEAKSLTARYGGTLILTATAPPDRVDAMSQLLSSFSTQGRVIYALSGTMKYEIPVEEIRLSDLFSKMAAAKQQGTVNSWGVSSCTLEDAFIRIALSSGAAVDASH